MIISEVKKQIQQEQNRSLYTAVKRNLQVFNTGDGGFQPFMFGQIPVELCNVKTKFREYRNYKKRIVDVWDPAKCSPIIVRDLPEENCFEVADGGKRVLAAIENKVEYLPALVSMNGEPLFAASWFIRQDEGKDTVTLAEKHAVRVSMGDEFAIKIDEIFAKRGIRLNETQAPIKGFEDNIAVWSKYSAAYRIMSHPDLGQDCLEWILDILTDSNMVKERLGLSAYSIEALQKLYANSTAVMKDSIKKVITAYLKARCWKVIQSEATACYPYVDKRTRLFYLYSDVILKELDYEVPLKTASKKGPRISGPGHTYESSVAEYMEKYPGASPADIAKALEITLATVEKHMVNIMKYGVSKKPVRSITVKPEATRALATYASKFEQLDRLYKQDSSMSDSALYMMTGISLPVIKRWREEYLPLQAEKAKEQAKKAKIKAELILEEAKKDAVLKNERDFLLQNETFITRDFATVNNAPLTSAFTRLETLGCIKEAQRVAKAPITWRSPYFNQEGADETLRIRQSIGGKSKVRVKAIAEKAKVSLQRAIAQLKECGYTEQENGYYAIS